MTTLTQIVRRSTAHFGRAHPRTEEQARLFAAVRVHAYLRVGRTPPDDQVWQDEQGNWMNSNAELPDDLSVRLQLDIVLAPCLAEMEAGVHPDARELHTATELAERLAAINGTSMQVEFLAAATRVLNWLLPALKVSDDCH